VRLYNGVRRAVDRLRGAEPRLHEEALLEAARRATGLDDFGEGPWREAFRVLLAAYDEESRLNPFGRTMVEQELGAVLRNRLAFERAFRDDPALREIAIVRPIFVLGLPRTGTTALHFLLGQDPDRQVLEYWLAAAPGPRPPRERWETDPRFRAAARGLGITYWLDPGLRAIHDLTAEGPDECRHLFLQSFLDHTFDANATIPSYTKYFEAQDMRPAYERHRDLLRWIGSSSPGRQWVLKYPAHMRNLATLLDVYPDACIVQTHRDPAKVLPSVCSLVAGWRGIYEDWIDPAAIGRWQLDLYAGWLESAARVRARCDPARFFDLHFRELVSDPLGAIGRLYDHFGLRLTGEAERRMAAWHATNPQGRHGGHRYRAEDYGLSTDAIRERFGDYVERFGVEREG
jgi:hypothetical protein